MDGTLLLAEPPAGFATCFALRLPVAPGPDGAGVRRANQGPQAAAQCADACGADAADEASR
jgi:hypothetical protein